MKRLTSDNKMLGYELMKAYPNISCFSTTRHGGCSKGNYASFNCNGYCGDEADDVNRNRELLRSLLPGDSVELVIPHQTHGDRVKVVDAIDVNRDTGLEGVDALVTDIPGYCLCVAIAAANAETKRPTLIIGNTVMGRGAVTADGANFEGK